jgi:hypothetical protein
MIRGFHKKNLQSPENRLKVGGTDRHHVDAMMHHDPDPIRIYFDMDSDPDPICILTLKQGQVKN